MTLMVERENSREPENQDPEPTEEGSPVPDPELENGGDAEDVPGAT
jgi:hypothetical protein